MLLTFQRFQNKARTKNDFKIFVKKSLTNISKK